MEITEVKIFPVRDKKLRAFVSIVLDGSFMVNDIKVIQGKDGFFISMPSRRKKNGRFKDIAHPLNQETRQAMEDRIVAEYRRVAEGGGAPHPESDAAAEARPEGAPPAAAPAESPEAASRDAGESPTTASRDAGESPTTASRDAGEGPAADDKSLEEVAEAHLSDSYWTT